jgi:hypothetical protein
MNKVFKDHFYWTPWVMDPTQLYMVRAKETVSMSDKWAEKMVEVEDILSTRANKLAHINHTELANMSEIRDKYILDQIPDRETMQLIIGRLFYYFNHEEETANAE